MLQIEIAGESLTLLAERALWWPAQSTLLIADAHFGKGLTFRARGVAVPSGTSDATMDRLAILLARTGATRVAFLADLPHAREARQPALMATLAGLHAPGVEWVLVRGNHDLHAGVPAELGLTVVDEPWRVAPFALCHHPDARPGTTCWPAICTLHCVSRRAATGCACPA